MYTIDDYLRSLDNDKNNLVNYLNIKGQTASTLETFTTLVPKVLDISTVNNQSKSITVTTNNIYTLTPDTGYTGLSSAEITVNVNPSLQSKSETLTENGTITITPDTGYYGLESVSVTTNIPSGKVSQPHKDVNFYDFENTILYSYTKAEFLALTEMPSVPETDVLKSQGWNWSFADAQAYVQEYGILNVGAIYTTQDGGTRIYLTISNDGILEIPLNFIQSNENAVTVNWGDNSTPETFSGTIISTTHTYSSIGDYIINLIPAEGSTITLGYNSSQTKIIGTIQDNYIPVRNMVNKIICGDRCSLTATSTFYNFYNLQALSLSKSITTLHTEDFSSTSLDILIIPDTCTSITTSAFSRLNKAKTVIFPNTNINLTNNLFQNTSSIREFIIPSSWTSTPSNLFANSACKGLTSIIIPKTVTTINGGMINTSFIAYIDCSHHTQVISATATNVFGTVGTDTKIIVPDALYDSWIAETNWANYVNNIIKKSDWDNL